MNEEVIAGSVIGNVLAITGTATQTNETLQTISLIITILGGIATFVMVVLIPVITKLKKYLEDKKLTKEEIEDLVDTAKEGIEKFKDGTDKGTRE